jgi:hypothetical protein
VAVEDRPVTAAMARGVAPIAQMHDPADDPADGLRVDAAGLHDRFIDTFQGDEVDDRPPAPGRMV